MEQQKESKAVKETVEFINGAAEVAVAGKKIMKDGKIDLADVQHVGELVRKHEVLVEAVKGADQIPAELKDLSLEELQQIGAAAVAAYAKFKGA